jgi:hypothetical protein
MAMTAEEMEPAVETRRALSALDFIGRFKEMTSLAEAESKHGPVVQSAGGQIFGIERTAVGTRGEKLKIGTPDGFVKIDVALNQPDIDAVLHEKTAGVVNQARELRTPSPPALGGRRHEATDGGHGFEIGVIGR